jgi:hypothetical protein
MSHQKGNGGSSKDFRQEFPAPIVRPLGLKLSKSADEQAAPAIQSAVRSDYSIHV